MRHSSSSLSLNESTSSGTRDFRRPRSSCSRRSAPPARSTCGSRTRRRGCGTRSPMARGSPGSPEPTTTARPSPGTHSSRPSAVMSASSSRGSWRPARRCRAPWVHPTRDGAHRTGRDPARAPPGRRPCQPRTRPDPHPPRRRPVGPGALLPRPFPPGGGPPRGAHPALRGRPDPGAPRRPRPLPRRRGARAARARCFDSASATSSGRTPRHPGHGLRVQLADRRLAATNPLVELAQLVVGLVAGRVTASEVLGLAAHDAVARRFGFDEDDLATLGHWVAESGARWGLDAVHRGEYGLGRWTPTHGLAALDRLALGVAVAADSAGRAPPRTHRSTTSAATTSSSSAASLSCSTGCAPPPRYAVRPPGAAPGSA